MPLPFVKRAIFAGLLLTVLTAYPLHAESIFSRLTQIGRDFEESTDEAVILADLKWIKKNVAKFNPNKVPEKVKVGLAMILTHISPAEERVAVLKILRKTFRLHGQRATDWLDQNTRDEIVRLAATESSSPSEISQRARKVVVEATRFYPGDSNLLKACADLIITLPAGDELAAQAMTALEFALNESQFHSSRGPQFKSEAIITQALIESIAANLTGSPEISNPARELIITILGEYPDSTQIVRAFKASVEAAQAPARDILLGTIADLPRFTHDHLVHLNCGRILGLR